MSFLRRAPPRWHFCAVYPARHFDYHLQISRALFVSSPQVGRCASGSECERKCARKFREISQNSRLYARARHRSRIALKTQWRTTYYARARSRSRVALKARVL